ncbi:4920_t:CDS:1, partial [Diversispora eburnea]
GESWKNESIKIKDRYKRMAKNVKKEFKKKVTSLCFIHGNLTGTDYNETNPPMDLNSPNTIHHNYPLNIDQNSSGTTYYDPPMIRNFQNIDQNTSDTIHHNHTFITTNICSTQQTYPH